MQWIIKQVVFWVIENYLQKECLSPGGTSKASRIEPIRLTVSSMSCDLSIVIAYYDDKWTYLSSWSLNPHFSSFHESSGHLPLSSRWTALTAQGREHAWLDTDDCFPQMNIFTVISQEIALLACLCWSPQYLPCNASFLRKRLSPSCSLLDNCVWGVFTSFPFVFVVYNVQISHSCWSPHSTKL